MFAKSHVSQFWHIIGLIEISQCKGTAICVHIPFELFSPNIVGPKSLLCVASGCIRVYSTHCYLSELACIWLLKPHSSIHYKRSRRKKFKHHRCCTFYKLTSAKGNLFTGGGGKCCPWWDRGGFAAPSVSSQLLRFSVEYTSHVCSGCVVIILSDSR